MRGVKNPYMFGHPDVKPYIGYYEFKNIDEIKQYFANHIKKLNNDIQWSKTSVFGFFVNTGLKNEKINGLQKILNTFIDNSIDIKNHAEIIKSIEAEYQHLHDGIFFSEESHKIIEGIKKYFEGKCVIHDKKATYNTF